MTKIKSALLKKLQQCLFWIYQKLILDLCKFQETLQIYKDSYV
ncbi:MAG: hypothetical protein RMZ69_04145 [Nostoc sp. ChiQUE01a]|nr:hypothetical protein [Nostoc sp. ChiQUE01a]